MTANPTIATPVPAPLHAPGSAPPPAQLLQRLQQFPPRHIATPSGQIAYRQSGAAARPTHVLLHGIGSSSANWLAQLEAAALNSAFCLLAWDAPGYGSSDALSMDTPTAADYAQRLWAWLGAMDALRAQDAKSDATSDAASAAVASSFILVGHSLGCLMAASAAVQQPQRVGRLILLAPAQGHARAPAAERDKKLQDRLDTLARLGPAGMAQARGAAMLSASASADQVAFVQHAMAQINPAGYAQAARMLAGGHLLSDVGQFADQAAIQDGKSARPVVLVASGSADTITPPAGCQQVAAHIKAPYVSLGAVGHACAVEAADEVTRLIGLAAGAATSVPPAATAFAPASASSVPAAPTTPPW